MKTDRAPPPNVYALPTNDPELSMPNTTSRDRTITKQDIAELWEWMASWYGDRWIREYGEQDDGKWYALLNDLTPAHLQRGLDRCGRSARSWPPSGPEFRDMCWAKPEDLGVPPFELAYREAVRGTQPHCKHEWSHPTVYHAAYMTGGWTLHHVSEDRARALFRADYECVVRRYMAGESLVSPPSRRLEQQAPRPKATYESVLERIAALRTILRMKR